MRIISATVALGVLVAAGGCRVLAGSPDDGTYLDERCGTGEVGGGLIALPASGDGVILDGALGQADPSWARPSSTCTGGSTSGTYLYELWTVENGFALDATVTIDAIGGGVSDTMLFVYEGAALPLDLETCLAADDDSGNGVDASITVTVPAGGRIAVVVTSFGTQACGSYELHVATQ